MEITLIPNNKVVMGILNKLSRNNTDNVDLNQNIVIEEKCPYSKKFLKKIAKSMKEVENGEVYRKKPNQTVE